MRLFPAALLFAAFAAQAAAQPATIVVAPTVIIAARQSGMDLSATTVGAFKAAIKNKDDVKALEESAEGLAGWATVVPTLFPPGTDKGHDTAALPAIWTDNAGFLKDAGAYQDATKKLAAAAKAGDRAAFVAAFKDTAKACGACHKGYKKKES